MEDIYSACREGNVRFVKQWLEETTNDLNQGSVFFVLYVQPFVCHRILLRVFTYILCHSKYNSQMYSYNMNMRSSKMFCFGLTFLVMITALHLSTGRQEKDGLQYLTFSSLEERGSII